MMMYLVLNVFLATLFFSIVFEIFDSRCEKLAPWTSYQQWVWKEEVDSKEIYKLELIELAIVYMQKMKENKESRMTLFGVDRLRNW